MVTNATFIEQELAWLATVIQTRLQLYFAQPAAFASVEEVPLPAVPNDASAYAALLKNNVADRPARLLLALALAPLVKPQLFDALQLRNADTDRRFAEFGGVQPATHNGLLPTVETWLFVLCGDDVAKKLERLATLAVNPLLTAGFIVLDEPPPTEPFTASVIRLSATAVQQLLGTQNAPQATALFPAKKLTTQLEWSDLVLEEAVMKQVEEISAWVKYGHQLHTELGLGAKLSPGHRCLFYGPSGTGKTLTATLIGKQTGLPVYRIDLSQVVSKYIGETEKNLSLIFEQAGREQWILFFDEADALFGKRTAVKDAHDRFANQEVSYLLQQVEEYAGLVILATNFKANIDDAFARRFQNVIAFPIPKAPQRAALWRSMLSPKLKPEAGLDVDALATRYELSGGSIINVIRYSALMALKRGDGVLATADVMEGVKREYVKEGKAM